MANTDRTSGRLALRLQLTDDFSALFAADALTYDETNSMFKLIAVFPAPPIALINRFTPVPYDERWLSQSDFFNFAGGPNSSRGDLYGAALTLRYDLGAAELKSISAYRDNVVHSDQDADLSPVTVLDEYDVSRQDQFSQELQASGTSLGERLNWVLGLYYFEESVHNKVDFELVPALQPIIGNRSFSNDLRVRNESYAAFGQANYGLTEQLRLTTGLRYTHDRKEVDRRNLTYPSGVPNQPQAIREASSDDVSTRVGLDYQWTPQLMTYVSAAKGYKAGGFNGRASSVGDFNEYEPETVWTYELGLRSDFLDRRVRFNATAFYSDYSDLQLQISGSTTVNGAPAPFNVVTNVPKARIVGGELELRVIPVRGLELSAEAGFTDARVHRAADGCAVPRIAVDRQGQRVRLHAEDFGHARCAIQHALERSLRAERPHRLRAQEHHRLRRGQLSTAAAEALRPAERAHHSPARVEWPVARSIRRPI